jgi:hypothetical protein
MLPSESSINITSSKFASLVSDDKFIGKDPDFPGLFLNTFGLIRSTRMVLPRIRVQAKTRQVGVGVQM